MIIKTRADANAIYEDIVAVVEGRYPEGTRIDWEDLYDRVEGRGHDLGDDLTSIGIKAIRKIVHEVRRG